MTRSIARLALLASLLLVALYLGSRLLEHVTRWARGKDVELQKMARLLAEKVKQTGADQQIGPLNPYERRLVHLAQARLGPAPAPWAWLAFGSQARGEQSLRTDQDNGIVYADDAPAGADA